MGDRTSTLYYGSDCFFQELVRVYPGRKAHNRRDNRSQFIHFSEDMRLGGAILVDSRFRISIRGYRKFPSLYRISIFPYVLEATTKCLLRHVFTNSSTPCRRNNPHENFSNRQ